MYKDQVNKKAYSHATTVYEVYNNIFSYNCIFLYKYTITYNNYIRPLIYFYWDVLK